jgi:hypothetical protein
MKDVIFLLFHLLTLLAKLLRPGGSRTLIAENLLLKQQLIIHSRSRQRAPNLTARDRALLGFWGRNPRFGCSRIAPQINLAFGLEVDKDSALITTHCFNTIDGKPIFACLRLT